MSVRVAAWILSASPLLSGACDTESGQAELSWIFVDRAANHIYPGNGSAPSSCQLCGEDENGRLTYDLVVRTRIWDPNCDPANPALADDTYACQVMPPVTFPCDRSRGTIEGIPTTGEPYLFEVDVIAIPAKSTTPGVPTRKWFEPDPTCVATPGARTRTVKPGRLTDLSVYQLMLQDVAWLAPIEADDCPTYASFDGNTDQLLNLDTCNDPTF